MSLVGFKARNHQQQLVARGPRADCDERATPPELFASFDRRFHFTVDACALPHNAKCERFYTPDDDGLVQDWAGERVWCNPPYSSIEPWVEKAHFEWSNGPGAELIAMLLPANRTEQGWWQDHVEPYRDRGGYLRVEFLAKRLRFLAPGAKALGSDERPPFGCALLIFDDMKSSTASGTDAGDPKTMA
jgi:phage N-6-adenine-methyltransferase